MESKYLTLPSNSAKPFDSIEFVKQFGGNEIMVNVLTDLGFNEMDDDVLGEILEEQYTLLDEAAVNAAKGRWDCSSFLSFYPNLKSYFFSLIREETDRIEWNNRVDRLRKPGASGWVTVYCPRGCNQISVDAEEPWDSCAACGQMMTSHAEDSYYDGLVRSGQAM